MMLSEDVVVVCGLLMGLNALDYNVMMSGEEFDKSVSQHMRHNILPQSSTHMCNKCNDDSTSHVLAKHVAID
jgi:hypothetical protein